MDPEIERAEKLVCEVDAELLANVADPALVAYATEALSTYACVATADPAIVSVEKLV